MRFPMVPKPAPIGDTGGSDTDHLGNAGGSETYTLKKHKVVRNRPP